MVVAACAGTGAPRSRGLAVVERVLGIDPTGERDMFRVYTDLPDRVPMIVWQVLRGASIACYVSLVATLVIRPDIGLFVLFHAIVPAMPLVFFVAPGLWRNVCPMAASNQLPRLLGVGGRRAVPTWLRNRGYLVAMVLFFGIAGSRLAGLDGNGRATATVLVVAFTAAVTGGLVFKGKSGWCSSICPLLPLQRAYGQTPFVTVRNSHCTSCVGCAKNCYDFRPRAAWQADMADEDPRWSGPRRLFAATLPGFVTGFFVVAEHGDVPMLQRFLVLGLAMLVSIGVFYALEVTTRLSPAMLTVSYAAVALNAFYWFTGPALADVLSRIVGAEMIWLRWVVSAMVAALTLLWIARTRVSELQFALASGKREEPVLLGMPRLRRTPPEHPRTGVRFGAGADVVAADGTASILDLAENAGAAITAGCRMGICGADPVDIVDGAACLSTPSRDELTTLARLGMGDSARMACSARIGDGVVTVSLTPGRRVRTTPTNYDTTIETAVIIGGGIAGVTAADFVRRGHPDCEIVLVGQESHPLYNRMEIATLLTGHASVQRLHLMPDDWYDDNRITLLAGTTAERIDPRSHQVHLAGTTVPYDKLILAMGARATTPPVHGIELPGSFVLRRGDDALAMRSYADGHRSSRAVVGGAGLLGLEAAIALQAAGLQVTLLVRGDRLLGRQIDADCSRLVADHLTGCGIEVLFGAEADRLTGETAVAGVQCRDGRTVECDVFVAATGITPDAELAREAGIPVGRGVLVDDRMHTGVADVFAAGDVAELDGQVPGLWSVAIRQAEVAAVNALGGDLRVDADTPAATLKGVGLDLFSVGKVDADPPDQVIVADAPHPRSYRRLVLSEGRVVGATVVGEHPDDVTAAHRAVREHLAVSAAARAALKAGDWSVLDDAGVRAGLA